MTINEIRTQVSRIAMAKRNGALKSNTNADVTRMSPIEIIDQLAGLVHGGVLSIEDIKNAQPFTGVAPVAASAFDTAQVTAVSAVASRAETTALDALGQISKVSTALSDKIMDVNSAVVQTSQVMDKLAKRFDQVEQSIGAIKVDEATVNAAVAKVVADAFAPFKQAVVDAGAESVVGDLSAVHMSRTASTKEIFGVELTDMKGNPLMVEVWNSPDAPAIDANFVWSTTILRHLLLAQTTGNNVWFGGEKGTGKSETARQFAAYTGRAFKRINFHKYTTSEDYAGAVGLKDGNTTFVKGDFLSAFTSPSTVVLLDEITNADPAELATLNGFLEPNSAVSYGGSVHRRASGVLVFAADNTLGSGDDSGRYAGTRSMNASLVDRFAQVIRFDFLPMKSEVKAVMNHTGCTQELAQHVIKAVNVARGKVQTADIVDAPSIRSVIAFINACKYLTVDEAWDAAIAHRQPSESAAALSAIKAACIDENLIANNI
jgi:MoxR-like ATPase